MEAARLTVQDLGYSGLTFRELAKKVGIKSASIHYYFETKGDMSAALVRQYTSRYAAYLDEIASQHSDLKTCLDRYVDIFADTLRSDNRMCLAGILGAERNALPDDVCAEVVRYGVMNEDWLARILGLNGRGEVDDDRSRARAIYAAVQGAQLIAHSRGDLSVFHDIVATYRAIGLLPE